MSGRTRRAALVLIAVALAVGLAACGGSSDSGSDGTTPPPPAAKASTAPAPGPGPGGASASSADEIDPELHKAIAEAAESGVPVRIPTHLLAHPPNGAGKAEVLRSPPDSYTLGLTAHRGCHLKSECTAAVFSGFAGGGELSGRRVSLAQGIAGAYEPGRCGPGCKFGTVEWVQDGNRYGVGVAGLPLAKLVALADDAISAPPLGG